MRVLITGAAGFIGSQVAEEMVLQGDEVLGIDDLSGGMVDNVPEGVRFETRDCTQDLDALFKDFRPEAVLHLAAYAAEGLSHHIPVFNYRNNLQATANVLSASHRFGVERFVFTSSIAAYGHPPNNQLLVEDTECRPCDPYGIAKHACEQHIACFHAYYGGPNYTIFRPHNVFGPRQNIADPYRNVVGIFFRCILEKKTLPIFGDGAQTRDFSYIDVVAKSIAKSVRSSEAVNEVFNVGGDQSLSVLELAKRLLELTGSSSEVEFLPARQEVVHAHADHAKARRVFAEVFESALSIDEGLRRTWDYVASRPIPEMTPCPAEIEVWDRLPPSWKTRLQSDR